MASRRGVAVIGVDPVGQGRFAAPVSAFPVRRRAATLHKFLRYSPDLLSVRGATGFLSRARSSSLRVPARFPRRSRDSPASDGGRGGRMSSGHRRGPRRTLVVDAATSARLGRVRQRGTAPELQVRALLRQLGIRWGHQRVRLPGSPDIVNLSAGWCIFVHGCFWHSHKGCQRATLPRRNNAFWRAKFTANRSRDARVLRQLRANGLKALVVWECDAELRPAIVRRRLATDLAPTPTAAGTRTGRRVAASSRRSGRCRRAAARAGRSRG